MFRRLIANGVWHKTGYTTYFSGFGALGQFGTYLFGSQTCVLQSLSEDINPRRITACRYETCKENYDVLVRSALCAMCPVS